MQHEEYDETLKDMLMDFEESLRHHLNTSQEFQSLVDYIAKKHGSIALYVAAQILGAHRDSETGVPSSKRRRRRAATKRSVPLSFELNKNDLEFLSSLKIRADI